VNNAQQKRFGPIVICSTLVLLGGLSIWYWGPPSSAYYKAKELNQAKQNTAEVPDVVELRDSTQDHFVLRYVAAYKTRNCAEVAACTRWVQERVQAIQSNSTDEASQEQERSELCAQLFERQANRDRITILGLDDLYLIPFTAEFEIEGADPGRQDLDAAVIERVWGIFGYGDQNTAPKTEAGDAIRSLRAGLNISVNNLALKGSVTGNWEIDFDSISLQW
jgi:hypothetical protein